MRPALYNINKNKDMITEFKGYNRNLVINDNEFYDMQNMVSDHYPVLTAGCSWRGKVTQIQKDLENKYNKLFTDKTNDKLVVIAGGGGDQQFFYDGIQKGTFEGECSSIVMIGSKICLFPAAYFYDTETHTFGDLSEEWDNITGLNEYAQITYKLCDKEGNDIAYTTEKPLPEERYSNSYWLDTSQTPYVLYQFNSDGQIYEEVNSTYVRIYFSAAPFPADFPDFKVGDSVEISGSIISSLNKKSNIVTAVNAGTMVVKGMIGENTVQSAKLLTIKRSIPYMPFIVEHGNRLWGCSADGREIYACKIGKPSIWHDYSGISTDSYAATIGSGGKFTGAISFNGYIWFFKEDRVYKIYDSNFPAVSIIEQPIDGVESGSENSLAVIDGVLYYKSATAVIAFTGDNTYRISDALGDDFKHYKYAEAGELNGKYYLCMRDMRVPIPYSPEDVSWDFDAYTLFVYDTRKRMWHKEDIGTENAVG